MTEDELIAAIPSLIERANTAKTAFERYEAARALDEGLSDCGLGDVVIGYCSDPASFQTFRPTREAVRDAAFDMGREIACLEQRLTDDGGRIGKRRERLSKRAKEVREIIRSAEGTSLDEKARTLAVEKSAWIEAELKKGRDRVVVRQEASKRFPSRNTLYRYAPKV